MGDLTESIDEIIPGANTVAAFFHATKAAANDTITFNNYTDVNFFVLTIDDAVETNLVSKSNVANGVRLTLAGGVTGEVSGFGVFTKWTNY